MKNLITIAAMALLSNMAHADISESYGSVRLVSNPSASESQLIIEGDAAWFIYNSLKVPAEAGVNDTDDRDTRFTYLYKVSGDRRIFCKKERAKSMYVTCKISFNSFSGDMNTFLDPWHSASYRNK